MKALRLGTRGSALAKTQSGQVADAITAATGRPVELVIITTRGDVVQDRPLSEVGGKGLFTKEIEDAMLRGDVDFAVHSLKDMPVEGPPGLVLASTPVRQDPRDALCGARLAELPAGARVGTGSLRRHHQLAALRPDLNIVGVRGNVDTRLRKVKEGELDAVMLAYAGLRRLGLAEAATEVLELDAMIPAVGQGALALQCREGDADVLAALDAIHHLPTAICVRAERSFLAGVEGSCHVPAAAHAVLEGDVLAISGCWVGEDGVMLKRTLRADPMHGVALGRALARALLGQDA